MRVVQIAVLVLLVGFVAGNAWGQLGLYGSPEMYSTAPTGSWRYPSSPQMLPVSPTGSWSYPANPGYYPAAAHASAVQPAPPLGPAMAWAPGGVTQPAGALNAQQPTPIPLGQPSLVPQPQAGYGVQNSPAYFAPGTNGYGCQHSAFGRYAPATGRFSQWYASASALMMGRNRANMLWTTYEAANEANQMDEYSWSWAGGYEIRIGRRFCRPCEPSCGEYDECGGYGGYRAPRGVGGLGNWALEATYWGLSPLDSYMDLSILPGVPVGPAGFSTPLMFAPGNVEFNGNPATDWFDVARSHRVWRRSLVRSLELSVVRGQFHRPAQRPLTIDWSLGMRYFRFDDRLIFGSLRGDIGGIESSWANPAQAAYLEDEIENNLIGFQAGLEAKYNVSPTCRIFLAPKFGIYDNHINNNFRLHLGDGTVATQTAYPGEAYPVASSQDIVSFLTQLDLGLQWNFTRNWSLRVGYRVVVATGIGLADDQIPAYITDIPEIRNIDHNSQLILHGGFVGAAYNF